MEDAMKGTGTTESSMAMGSTTMHKVEGKKESGMKGNEFGGSMTRPLN